MSRWHQRQRIPDALRVLLDMPYLCAGTVAGPGCGVQVAPGHCHLCHRGGSTTLDHLTPLSMGGRNVAENLRPAHLTCNAARGTTGAGRAVPTITLPW